MAAEYPWDDEEPQNAEPTQPIPPTPDLNPYWQNIEAIAQSQRAKGLSTYSMGLECNHADISTRITYLEEELVDALYYLEWIKDYLSTIMGCDTLSAVNDLSHASTPWTKLDRNDPSTYPRPGDKILCALPRGRGCRIDIGKWLVHQQKWFFGFEIHEEADHEITHWMPLPIAPNAEPQGEGG